jgi:hypothetical protein
VAQSQVEPRKGSAAVAAAFGVKQVSNVETVQSASTQAPAAEATPQPTQKKWWTMFKK